jgi:hypothetical protein
MNKNGKEKNSGENKPIRSLAYDERIKNLANQQTEHSAIILAMQLMVENLQTNIQVVEAQWLVKCSKQDSNILE